VTQSGAIKILVVDDDLEQSALIGKFLAKHGYTVMTAPSPVEAMQLLHTADIKLVITDLMMPHVDGISFAQQIHAIPRLKDLPVILITAWSTEEISEKGMRKGIAMTMSKPLDFNKLLDLVGFATH
jgi:two-component system, chemotaxis family, chemotaxis protein CheY